jgi:hypothetical protein
MKRIFFTLIFMFAIGAGSYAQPVNTTTLNSADITGTVTLDQNTIYLMQGYNIVRAGGKIVIPEGTLIKGDFTSKGTLIIERGGIIYANGTAQRPIVFTSNQPAGTRLPGDWGGIIILGRSGIGTASGADSAIIEGFPAGVNFYYGGQPIIQDDSSGVLRYVRLEYPGVNQTAQPGNEINGLTMGGVGSRTVLEYIQVSYCGDDSFEWFGGTVNAKYLVSIGAVDDDFDCDNGFRGKIQFGLIARDSAVSDVSGSHMFELSNNSNSPANFNSPRMRAIFSNITAIGPNITSASNPQFKDGLDINKNSQPSIFNSVLGGYEVLINFNGSGVCNAAQGDTIHIRNNAYSYITELADSSGSSFSPTPWLMTPAWGSSVHNPLSALQLDDPLAFYGASGSDPISGVNWWEPMAGSPVLSGASFSDPLLAGFETTAYRGAFGDVTEGGNWLVGWSNFNPNHYTATVGINQISSNVPERFSLSQNYPNPFNPSTKINFNVPAKGFVTLKVYDALGQEVAELVNQNMNVGEYAYDFNASSLSSGIYFYTLRGENFVQTKKMLLVK